MHTVVRTYSGKGAKELIDILERNKADVEKLCHFSLKFLLPQSEFVLRDKDLA